MALVVVVLLLGCSATLLWQMGCILCLLLLLLQGKKISGSGRMLRHFKHSGCVVGLTGASRLWICQTQHLPHRTACWRVNSRPCS
jgi:hypothetical protein